MKQIFLLFAAIIVASCSSSQRPIEPEMVYVPGGTFLMGSTDGESDEAPVHQVTLDSFYIGKYEVTQSQWQAIMGTTVNQQRDKAGKELDLAGVGDTYPMYYVSWDEVQEFISRLNAATGKHYRLPTEAEWEYAARGGNKSQGYIYSGSDSLDNVAWYYENSNDSVHPVGTKSPNELGIYDMSGNVSEWCLDQHDARSNSVLDNYYCNTNRSGVMMVHRGGCAGNSVRYLPVNLHGETENRSYPNTYAASMGFRLAIFDGKYNTKLP